MTCDRLLVSSTNKTDHHDIAEILLKVALNTIKQTSKNKMADKSKYTCFLLTYNTCLIDWNKILSISLQHILLLFHLQVIVPMAVNITNVYIMIKKIL